MQRLAALAILVVVCFWSSETTTGADRDGTAKEAISVSIAIPEHHMHRSLNEYDHFHVLVTNNSEKPIRLWTDRFSWGYDNLSFEIIGDEGKVTKVSKKPREWTKNFPEWLSLGPGESYVLNVDFYSERGQAIWNNAPKPTKGGSAKRLIRMRAVYEVTPDDESGKLGVWTGKVVSAVRTYAIW
jgi:hypothetical protein